MSGKAFALAILAIVGLGRMVAANDTSAALGTGGLQFVQNESVEMRSEDLFVSEREIRVRYVFRNISGQDVASIVAFPMPDIVFDWGQEIDIPSRESDNFLDFKTIVNGVPVEAAVERRVIALSLERTKLLEDLKVPLMPFRKEATSKLDALPEERKAELVAMGLARFEEYDDTGKGMVKHLVPFNWTLKTTYYWNQAFPAGKEVAIEHRYRPSVGGTAFGTSYYPGSPRSPEEAARVRSMAASYCIDDAFKAAVMRTPKVSWADGTPFSERRISYILRTGANWSGSIGDFTLTVDKGAPENLVSFCAANVKKTGPTTFQIKAKDYRIERDLDVLILKPLPAKSPN
jgi:hypothetical protein